MDDNADDYEMDCDIINRPLNLSSIACQTVESSNMERSVTPPNSFMSMPPEFCSTPKHNPKEAPDSFLIRRARVDRNVLNGLNRFSSSPLFMDKFGNKTSNSDVTSQRSRLAEMRLTKSADSVRSLRLGPEGIPYEYINPFTPDAKLITIKGHKGSKSFKLNTVRKFELSNSPESDGLSNSPEIDYPTRPRLSEFNVSRFNEEFVQLKELGKGDHGCVYKCLNRMNGCLYAIKRTIKPIKSSIQERIVRNEIYAHGVLDHHNIVRNFSCWKEEGFVYIQNEYCNGGSLEDYIQANVITESLLRSLLLQIAHALRYIHKQGLAHMDIKPGNILVSIDKMNKDGSVDSDGGFSDDDKQDEVVFKLGDLGHVTKLDEENDVEEGDCRFLPREILEENFKNLDRADIFALGLTVFEAAGGGPLPKNGEEWQDIRNGNLKYLDQFSKEMNDILKQMIQPSPEKRPSAADLITLVKPSPPSPPRDEVFSCFQQYQHNNKLLEHKYEATGQFLKVLYKSHKQLQEKLSNGKEKTGSGTSAKKNGGVTKNSRVVGKKTKRSASTIF